MERVFRNFDANDDGRISRSELAALFEIGATRPLTMRCRTQRRRPTPSRRSSLARVAAREGDRGISRVAAHEAGSVLRAGGGKLHAGGERCGGEPHDVVVEFFECCNG
jgi:hypothetical protein